MEILKKNTQIIIKTYSIMINGINIIDLNIVNKD